MDHDLVDRVRSAAYLPADDADLDGLRSAPVGAGGGGSLVKPLWRLSSC